ncbi:hypothetical protein NLI96_g5018 [Meripilus lineatus]|uniref:Thiol methyltransferase 1 n=1 Tax=Meripilus lineatus TaxID=2056292 RepID=A0AAD5YHC3_9APHY|nr:hypothetical protein NLI96_g5018 [Physisporinus lineatus]
MSTSTPSPASLDHAQIQSVRQSIAQHGNDGWDRLWEAGVTPWETGDAQLSLKDLLESGQIDFPKSGHALIPGCGRGFDALLIASKLGLDVLAVDISPLAIDGGKK